MWKPGFPTSLSWPAATAGHRGTRATSWGWPSRFGRLAPERLRVSARGFNLRISRTGCGDSATSASLERSRLESCQRITESTANPRFWGCAFALATQS